MIWLLAQVDETAREAALKKGWWNLSFILLVGTVAVLFLIAMILLRRWKHKQLDAIEQDRAERRAGRSAERVDAWAASAERYVDRDKLSADDEPPFDHGDDREPSDEDDNDPSDNTGPLNPDEEDRDPFGLFKDKPYQDPDDDDDDFDEDDDEDWDEEDEEGR